MKRVIVAIVLVLLSSCNGTLGKNEENMSSGSEDASTGVKVNESDFSKTRFTDRAEELKYIREYIEYRMPLVIIQEEPKRMKEAQAELIGMGKDVSLEEAVKYTKYYDIEYERLWFFVTHDNLTIEDVKKKLSSFGMLRSFNEGEKETDINNLPLVSEREKENELPLEMEGNYSDQQKIFGDFNGDGKGEYAHRVLTKKGKGNPVEDGTPDEYEIQFSDKNIMPIKVDCCWFRLVKEGDLNNDGADEFSIAQSPMNGCIGSFKTFTIKNNRGSLLFESFAFFRCDEVTNTELEKLVVYEKGITYYFERDPNEDKVLKKRAF